jgi:hypothetical protein
MRPALFFTVCVDARQVPVLPSVDVALADCVVPAGWALEPGGLVYGAVADTPQRILEIAALYDGLVVVAIAPVTPLAEALKLDHAGVLQTVKRIYVQVPNVFFLKITFVDHVGVRGDRHLTPNFIMLGQRDY